MEGSHITFLLRNPRSSIGAARNTELSCSSSGGLKLGDCNLKSDSKQAFAKLNRFPELSRSNGSKELSRSNGSKVETLQAQTTQIHGSRLSLMLSRVGAGVEPLEDAPDFEPFEAELVEPLLLEPLPLVR